MFTKFSLKSLQWFRRRYEYKLSMFKLQDASGHIGNLIKNKMACVASGHLRNFIMHKKAIL